MKTTIVARRDLLPLVKEARRIVVASPKAPYPGHPHGLCQDWCVVFERLANRHGLSPHFFMGWYGPFDHAWARVDALWCDGTGDQIEGLFNPPVLVRKAYHMPSEWGEMPTDDMCPRNDASWLAANP